MNSENRKKTTKTTHCNGNQRNATASHKTLCTVHNIQCEEIPKPNEKRKKKTENSAHHTRKPEH